MVHDPRKAPFQPYLRKLADLMDLRDWQVAIADMDPDDADNICEVETHIGRRVARVRIGPKFLCSTAEERRAHLVHELLHLHFAPMDHAVRREFEGPGCRAYNQLFEYGIDAVAEVVARSMPLHLTLSDADADPDPQLQPEPEPRPMAKKPKIPKATKSSPTIGRTGGTATKPMIGGLAPKASKMKMGKSKGKSGPC